MEYGVYSEFDVKKHAETFINYLEVIIDEDGEVFYAVPSHQEMEIRRACNKLDVSRKELEDITPVEYYFDWMTWLSLVTGDLIVWTDFFMGIPNEKQADKLAELKRFGVYKGSVEVA